MKHSCMEDTEESQEMFMIKSRRMADILMLVSSTKTIHKMKSRENVFECKTCGRLFSSFQALGGHRTSHGRRARADYGDGELFIDHMKRMNMKKKKKKERHECPVCGVEFLMGQALGGHMRRHKPMAVKERSSFLFDLNLTPSENDLRV